MKRIGTHDGKFHADEALACALLQMIPAFSDSTITRTRDEAKLSEMDVVVDVGGVYDPPKHRYDHHQPSFVDTFSPSHKTLLSSAGLVYKHFAQQIIEAALTSAQQPASSEIVGLLYQKIYTDWIESFDAHDNGISAYPSDVRPAFHRPWDIFAQVNILNPAWNEPLDPTAADARFLQAVRLLGENFKTVLNRYVRSWLPGLQVLERNLTLTRLLREEGQITSDQILVLDCYCPWSENIYELEAQQGKSSKEGFLYVVYADSTGRSWRIQAVPLAADSFESRKSLPSAWRGLREAELDAVTGVPGGVFVHRSGFIGGHLTREGALKLAHLAISP